MDNETYTMAEIASALQISVSAVRDRAYMAKLPRSGEVTYEQAVRIITAAHHHEPRCREARMANVLRLRKRLEEDGIDYMGTVRDDKRRTGGQ